MKLPFLSGRLIYLPLFLLFCGGVCCAQDEKTAADSERREYSVTELLKLPGTVVAEGTNTRNMGKYKVTTYRAEEVILPTPIEVKINNKNVQVNKAIRLTILGGPFLVRAMPPVIWLDETAVGYGVESEDLDAIVVVTFDSSLLREGARIYLSYGDKQNKEDRVELPEKFKYKIPGDKTP